MSSVLDNFDKDLLAFASQKFNQYKYFLKRSIKKKKEITCQEQSLKYDFLHYSKEII